jgi:hypothetical protein
MAQADRQRKQAQFLKYCELPLASADRTFATFRANTPRLREALQAVQEVVAGKLKMLTLASGVDRGKPIWALPPAGPGWLPRKAPSMPLCLFSWMNCALVFRIAAITPTIHASIFT